ncbi:MAG TPA: glutamate racemase [Burkholderiales bacterium]|nr:glutamate racemase [Burkholderiales bacterium]
MSATGSENPIGMFDSGVGGLTILRAVREALPGERLVYVADAAWVPYGEKSQQALRDRCLALCGFLVERGAKAVVVACNTATACAIDALRARWSIPFIGVEPAVKPALAATKSGVVGVLATPATLASARYRGLIERFAGNARVVAQPCAGLAEHIERGSLDDARTEALLRGFVEPLLGAGADVIVLGCTHYPLVAHVVRRIAGPGVAVVENGMAVAQQLARQLAARGLVRTGGAGDEEFWSSGPPARLDALLATLWDAQAHARGLPTALPSDRGVSAGRG